jgi:UDP-2,3-diacylglucosamine pyrophosphatase LpxH
VMHISPEQPAAAGTKKIKLIISDFHLSRGRWLPDGRRNPLEDFHQDERFEEFLIYYSTGSYKDFEVELIINGDFFDPLAIIPVSKVGKSKFLGFPLEVEETAAVHQFKAIIEGHPICVMALRDFLARGKKIIFRWGNHDAAILWPKVQELLRKTLSPQCAEQMQFQVEPYVFDRICVNHGHQLEVLNQFDENRLFIERKTKHGIRRILNLPFGSFFVLGFLNRLKLRRSYINQVQPFRVYLRITLLTEPLVFLFHGLLAAWFFIKMRFITHPMRFARFKKTLFIIAEIFHRPSLEHEAEKLLTQNENSESSYDTLILGHNHQAALRIFQNGKQYINTGTWIPITSLDMSTLGHRILRTYALVEYADGKANASLKIWNGMPQITDDFV